MSVISERDAAFIDFVQTGKTAKLKAYCKKYGVQIPENPKVMAAGVYKATQYCTNIPAEIKGLAMQKCLEMGFDPFIGLYERRADDEANA